jgi:hypothetical protein
MYLQVVVLCVLFALFMPSRRFFGTLAALLMAGSVIEQASGGALVPAILENAARVLLIATFAAGGLAMFTRRLPSILALPAMALAVAGIALVRWDVHLPRLASLPAESVLAALGQLVAEMGLAGAGVVSALGVATVAVREVRRADPSAGRATIVGLGLLALYAVPAILRPWTQHWYYRGGLAGVAELVRGLAADVAWIARGVVAEGSLRLAANSVMIMVGSILAVFMSRTGLAREIVKTAAELGGDQPRRLALLLLAVVTVLFTTLSGLGSIIMVAMIVLPLLLSLEASAEAAAGLMLLGISLGGILNPANWKLYLEVFGLPRETVVGFSLPLFAIAFVVAVAFVWREFPQSSGGGEADAPVAAGAAPRECRTVRLPEPRRRTGAVGRAARTLAAITAPGPGGLRPVMAVTPVLPLVLILGLGADEVPAFVAALLAAALAYAGERKVDLLVASIVEGVGAVAPAVAILMGLGMLLKSLSLSTLGGGAPAVPSVLSPAVRQIVPGAPWSYVLVFTLLAPLALYRGPLNIWGMGLGLAEVVRSTGILGAPLVMGMLQSVGQVQGICDPTNTYNIWIAGHARVTTRRILVRTLPYAMVIAALGLVLAAFTFRAGFGAGAR